MTLQIHIERNGKQVKIGKIENGAFQYDAEYRESASAVPISISLPLQEQPFSAEATKTFFDGLLPEGFTRRSLAHGMHLDENDYLSILKNLGSECLGAIQVTSDDTLQAEASYQLLDREQVAALAKEGATKSAELVTKAHLSLTGASGKVGLYYDDEHDAWYLPKGSAPSTHIVKQSHVRLGGIVLNEQLCLETAKRLGIDVAESRILNMGNATDGEVLLATKRYDRRIPQNADRISGLLRPLRLHQEDFAQAMGIPAARKYESMGDSYLQRSFALLRAYSADPLSDIQKLWDIIVFNFLVGNTDSHLKNFSLLYDENLRGMRLAPAYDLVSTAVYESSTRAFSMSIGGKDNLDDVRREDFITAASEAGLGRTMAFRRLDYLCERFEPALLFAAESLETVGFTEALPFAHRILHSGGYKMITRNG